MSLNQSTPNYGNWIPGKMIAVPGFIGLVCLVLGILHWSFIIPAGLFLIIASYFAISRHLFSDAGSKIQSQVQDLLISHINWKGNGKVLDIGCGNGPLTIKIAQRYPKAKVVGIDSWKKNWDYAMQICCENARLAGVDDRVTFHKSSAINLPFNNEDFDLVVSNLVFHEVQGVKDKRELVHEALRVLKPGGMFVLQDLFLLKPYYGTSEELTLVVQNWGMSEVDFIRTCDEPFLPKLTKLPFMLGTMAILKGIK